MKKIANILTDGAFEDDGLYNVCKIADGLIPGIPTLIIGWSKVQLLKSVGFLKHVSIIEWKIDDDTYWTWGSRERRQTMEKDIVRFRKIALSKFVKPLKYVFLNVLTASDETVGNFIKSLYDARKKAIFINNDIVYVYYEGNSNIIGFSLMDADYKGIDRKIFLRGLYGGKNNVFIKDTNLIAFSIMNEFKNKMYVLPYLYSE